jgi:hypothetical protein
MEPTMNPSKNEASDLSALLSTPDDRGQGRTKSRWPRDFKKFMGWIFLAACLLEFAGFVLSIPKANPLQWYAYPLLWKLLYAPVFPFILSIINGVAWWTIWEGRRSARAWGIGASLTYILKFLRPFFIPLQFAWARDVGPLWVGIVGVVVFLRPDKHRRA